MVLRFWFKFDFLVVNTWTTHEMFLFLNIFSLWKEWFNCFLWKTYRGLKSKEVSSWKKKKTCISWKRKSCKRLKAFFRVAATTFCKTVETHVNEKFKSVYLYRNIWQYNETLPYIDPFRIRGTKDFPGVHLQENHVKISLATPPYDVNLEIF